MKFNISKDWIMKRARLEEGCSVEAGSPSGLGLLEPRPNKARWLWRRVQLFWWKIRYAYHARKLMGVSPLTAWDMAESTVESYASDIADGLLTPKDAAEEERDEWLACC